jgi:serine/threonine-protein kinase
VARIGDETLRELGVPGVSDPLVGTTIESYHVESVVGSGAMGIVYQGRHTVIGKPVAIKVLKADFAGDDEMVERLIREARTVNAIRHPAIVNAFGFGTLTRTNQPYIVMDLLVGEPLDVFIAREAPVPLKVAAGILDELLGVLAAAHEAGVIHRDLKPANCFLESKPGGNRTLRLLDFGLARQADRAGGSIRPTNPGTLLGTPAFMAPEQVLGEKVMPSTDLYAVGGIAYQMLTGHLPHEAPSAIEVLTQKMKFDPVRPKKWNPKLSDDLDEWMMRLLSRDPLARERDADVARRQLRKAVEPATLVMMASTAAPGPSKTGVVPKAGWANASTVVLDGSEPEASPDARTADHVSPWDAGADAPPEAGTEPTSRPQQSPFMSNVQVAPDLTPPASGPRPAAEPAPDLVRRPGRVSTEPRKTRTTAPPGPVPGIDDATVPATLPGAGEASLRRYIIVLVVLSVLLSGALLTLWLVKKS